MLEQIRKYLKYWYATRIKQTNYQIVFALKNVICTLPPVVIGDIKLARGIKSVWFSEQELEDQGKFAVGRPVRFLALGCIIEASNKALAKSIIFDNLKANAYRTLNIERFKNSCFVTIQPYFVEK